MATLHLLAILVTRHHPRTPRTPTPIRPILLASQERSRRPLVFVLLDDRAHRHNLAEFLLHPSSDPDNLVHGITTPYPVMARRRRRFEVDVILFASGEVVDIVFDFVLDFTRGETRRLSSTTTTATTAFDALVALAQAGANATAGGISGPPGPTAGVGSVCRAEGLTAGMADPNALLAGTRGASDGGSVNVCVGIRLGKE